MVGNRLRSARTAAGYSQTEMAKMISVSKQTLYKYENNIVTNVPSDKIERVAAICGVTPGYLMGWDDAAPAATSSPDPVELSDQAKQVGIAYDKADTRTKTAVEVALGIDFQKRDAKAPSYGSALSA